MKLTPVWHATIDGGGQLHVEAGGLFRSYLARLKNSRVRLVLRKEGRPKSRSQTGYLYGNREYEIGQVHDACMRQLRGLQPEPNPLQLRVSLAAMSMEDVSAYVDDLRAWALEVHGITTPDAHTIEAA